MFLRLGKVVKYLELYEVVGIAASIIALALFFLYGNTFDGVNGAGAHWKPMIWVYSYYREFIPESVLLGALGLVITFVLLRLPFRDFPMMAGRLARIFVSLCVLLAIYRIMNFYIVLFDPHDKDKALLAIDAWLFAGHQPSIILQSIITPWLSNIMAFFYGNWFTLIFVTIIAMLLTSKEAASEFMFTTLVTFYLGYIGFVIVPAIGPKYTLAAFYHITINGTLATVVQHFAAGYGVPRDCFPSLHTGISIVMLMSIRKHCRKLVWFYWPMVIGIICSTIYLREHYFIDLVAGTALSLATSTLCPKLVDRYAKFRQKQPIASQPIILPQATDLS